MADKNHENNTQGKPTGAVKTANVGAFSRRAMVESYNEEERTFTVSFASENPVLVQSFWSDDYYEVLKMDGMRTVRLDNAGVPLLDNHKRGGSVSKDVIGVAERHWTEGTKAYASVRISARADLEGLRLDIKDGIIKNVSCGYRVFEYTEKPRAEGETVPTFLATDWEAFEISLVPVHADETVGVRSENTEKHQIKIKSIPMAEEKKTVEAVEPQAMPPIDLDGERKLAIESERKRALAIHQTVAKLKLGDDFARALIEEGVSVETAQTRAIEKWTEQDPAKGVTATVSVGTDGTDKRRAAIGDALSLRAGQRIDKPADGAMDFRGMNLLRMAEEQLISEGVSTRGMSPRQIAETALNIGARAYHTSSDFPIILGNTINRTLRAAYELQPRTFMPFCRRGSASDFREMTRAQISGLVGNFDEVLEGAEYKYGSMNEAKESYKVAKYGQIIALTWEALINDDLSAFSRVPQAIAAKAAQKQSDIVWGILLNNPLMGDGVALFDAAHSNLGSATAINETGLNAARKAIRNQTGLEGDYINLTPRYMLVGPDKETEAQKILQATIVATKTADTNVFRGFTDLIVEPRVTGNKWFMTADPMQIDTIEYSFLDGEGELFTEQRTGFDVDGLEVKARMVFGAKAIDYRGLYYNPGA
jgi:hypothetical protein